MSTIDNVNNIKIKSYSVTGPASYSTGGITVDASADFSWIGFADVIITAIGSLPGSQFEVDLNVDQAGAEAVGKCAVKIVKEMYDRPTLGNVSGNPSGTTVQSSKTATATATGSSHTHALDHNHAAANTSTPTAGGDGVDAAVGGSNITTHTHSVDFPNLAVSTGATTQAHNRSFEYDHNHGSLTQATTDITATELPNATNISTTTFKVLVYGFGKT